MLILILDVTVKSLYYAHLGSNHKLPDHRAFPDQFIDSMYDIYTCLIFKCPEIRIGFTYNVSYMTSLMYSTQPSHD